MTDVTRQCPTCLDVLPLDSFGLRKSGTPVSECRKCVVARVKAWRKANPEHARRLGTENNQRRRSDPVKRAQDLERGNAARRARTTARPPIDVVCYRCGREFTRKAQPGARKVVCQPCRSADWAWKLYGLNSVTLPEFYEAHGNRCDICGGTESPTQWGNRMHIDHDHVSGRLRGLLCHGCNTAIGLMGEDPARFLAAADYLTSHRR